MDIKNFMKMKDNAYQFSQDGEFVFYVPETFFTKKYAEMRGEYIDIFGLLNYTIRDKNGKNNGLHLLKFPSVFTTKPSKMEKIKNIKLTKNSKEEDYRLLIYKKDDQIISYSKVPQMTEYCEMFFKMFIYADIPTTIPYNEIHFLFNKNMQINGNKYGLNAQLFGILVAELYRSKADKSKLFRNSDIKDYTDYQTMTVFEAPKNMSPYTSITSQNWDEAVVSAMTSKNKVYSPLERLFTI